MKRTFVSLILIFLGSAAWWTVNGAARFSMKKWDAKFESVLNHSLRQVGLTDQDLLSSLREIKKDANGEWSVRRISVKKMDPAKIEEIKESLKESGAVIEESLDKESPVLLVKKGKRIYQEIQFIKP